MAVRGAHGSLAGSGWRSSRAIATVHRRLFQSEDVERFDVSAFVRDLVSDMTGSANRDEISVRLDLERVDVPASNLKAELCRVLKEEGFISDYIVSDDPKPGLIRVTLKYTSDRSPVLQGLRRVSRPGLRRYVGAEAADDDDEAFNEKMERLTAQLAEQMARGLELDDVIRNKLGGLGYAV